MAHHVLWACLCQWHHGMGCRDHLRNVWLCVQTIGYARLLEALGLSNIRELEDLLITDAFHSGIIAGKLDQHQQCLQVR